LIASCGGKLTSAYLNIWNKELWQIVEVIEIINELHEEANSTEENIEDWIK
jgi:hypothetical protein